MIRRQGKMLNNLGIKGVEKFNFLLLKSSLKDEYWINGHTILCNFAE